MLSLSLSLRAPVCLFVFGILIIWITLLGFNTLGEKWQKEKSITGVRPMDLIQSKVLFVGIQGWIVFH